MRVLLFYIICFLFTGCTLRVGTVDETDPNYYRPGVVVGQFEIQETEFRGSRFSVMTCTSEVALRRQLDRVVSIRSSTRLTAREMRYNQISHLTGWGCNGRIVRGYPILEWVGNYQSPTGQWFTVYRVWQRDGLARRAFNLGLTAM